MKTTHILFLGLVVAFSSCSTAYRSGQTPDDVYYSPAPPQETYVRTDNQDERESYAYNNATNREDVEIRRGMRDSRYRDNNVIVQLGIGGYAPYNYDPYGYNPYGHNSYGYNAYGYDPYNSHGYGYDYNSLYYNPYNTYNNSLFVSPYNNYYYSPQVYVYPGTASTGTTVAPRRYNLGAYSNSVNTVRNTNNYDRPVNTTTTSSPVRTFNTRSQNNGSGAGNLIRRVFTPDNNSNNSTNSRSSRNDNNSSNTRSSRNDNNSNNNSTNTRSFRNDNNSNNNNNTISTPVRSATPSSSNSSSSGSSSAPVRTFKR